MKLVSFEAYNSNGQNYKIYLNPNFVLAAVRDEDPDESQTIIHTSGGKSLGVMERLTDVLSKLEHGEEHNE